MLILGIVFFLMILVVEYRNGSTLHKYRIINYKGKYKPQKRILFYFWTDIEKCVNTLSEADEIIINYKNKHDVKIFER